MRLLLPGLMLFMSFHVTAQEKILKEGYYPDGSLRYKGYFVNDQPAGEMTHYFPDGKIKALMVHNGSEVHAVLYGKNGGITTKGMYLDREKTGVWEYRKGERLVLKEEYKANKLDGMAILFFASGDSAEIKQWKSGVLTGEWKLFYDNGETRLQGYFTEGKLNGALKCFDYDGSLLVEGEYKNNLKEGEWKYYDKDGKLKRRQEFHSGISSAYDDQQMTREIDVLVRKGINIPDPAQFADDPEAYMKIVE